MAKLVPFTLDWFGVSPEGGRHPHGSVEFVDHGKRIGIANITNAEAIHDPQGRPAVRLQGQMPEALLSEIDERIADNPEFAMWEIENPRPWWRRWLQSWGRL